MDAQIFQKLKIFGKLPAKKLSAMSFNNLWFNIHVEHVINVATNMRLSDRQTGLSVT